MGQGPEVILKPEDAALLIGQTHSENTVLIGGQAVAFWIGYFDIQAQLPALTDDIDCQRGQPCVDPEIPDPERDRLPADEDRILRTRLPDQQRRIFRLENHLGTLPQLRIFALEPSMKDALSNSWGAN